MTIDWTKPIETVPCARNPEPVPCVYRDDGVAILGAWTDSDGCEETDESWFWGINEKTGKFYSLDGAVRNVQSIEETDPIQSAIALLTSNNYTVTPPQDADVRLVADIINAFECQAWVDSDRAMHEDYAGELARAVAIYKARKP